MSDHNGENEAQMRLEALLVIHQTADELSTPESIAPTPTTAHEAATWTAGHQAATCHRLSGDDTGAAPADLITPPDATTRMRGKTRRWGSSSSRPRGARAGASALGECAPFFFYPLMARYDEQAHTFRLLTEDCFLLEQARVTYVACELPR